jgi:hypothetical protein
MLRQQRQEGVENGRILGTGFRSLVEISIEKGALLKR